MAIVSIKSQQVTVYDADGWIMRAPVSSGTTGRETPAGVFSIVEKDKDHHSNLYDDAWMPNMERITWSGIALHGGPLPGYAASHGCVRMPYGFAEKLFDKTRIGMRVIIAPNDVDPVEFSHPALFVPNTAALAAAPAHAETLAREAASSAKTADDTKRAATIAARDAAPLTASLHKLEALKTRADGDLAFDEKALAAAKTDKAKAHAEDLSRRPPPRPPSWRRSSTPPKPTQRRSSTLPRWHRTPPRRPKPNGPMPPRRCTTPSSRSNRCRCSSAAPRSGSMCGAASTSTLEVPVTIRNPERPIGTHVFTAVARADGGLRWTAVTIDGGDSAKDALDRITIPQDVLDRIAPTAVPRSSIVVSDERLNRETNYRTEFVVVLNNQPQGGLAIRRHPDDVRVARRSSDDDGFGFNRGRDYWGGSQYGFPGQRGGQNYFQRQQGPWGW